MEKILHVVSFDVPLPADYGGVIDVSNRLRGLKENDIRVKLHCFEYGRGVDSNYDELAQNVFFYKRNLSLFNQFSLTPFIVKSRSNERLKLKLLEDNFPILLEGLHCLDILKDKRFSKRNVFVRIHNIEYEYYRQLAIHEKNILKKIFFFVESFKLKKFERALKEANHLFCITNNDLNYYSKINTNVSIWELGVSLNTSSRIISTVKKQALFHGNLSVNENSNQAKKLVDYWKKNEIKTPLIIAGKEAELRLKKIISKSSNVHLVNNPSNDELILLLAESAVSLLFSEQVSGMKIKLLHALYYGNTCFANEQMLFSTGLEKFARIIESENELVLNMQNEFSISNVDLEYRKDYLEKRFDQKENAKAVLELIFGVKKS